MNVYSVGKASSLSHTARSSKLRCLVKPCCRSIPFTLICVYIVRNEFLISLNGFGLTYHNSPARLLPLSLSLSTCWPLDIQITNQLCCITQNKLTYLQSSTRANDIFSVFTTYGLNGLEHFRARQTVPTKLATMNVIEFHRVKILKQMTHTHTSESQFHFGLRAR